MKLMKLMTICGVAAALVAAGILTRISVAWNQPVEFLRARALRHFMTAQ